MNYTEFEVSYEDGTSETVRCDQRDGQEFALWANRRGIIAPPGRDLAEVMPTVFFRVCAWSGHQRNAGRPVEWADWDKTAVAVNLVSVDPVDPTQPDGSDGSSPNSPSD
jgi:hypothetical protein